MSHNNPWNSYIEKHKVPKKVLVDIQHGDLAFSQTGNVITVLDKVTNRYVSIYVGLPNEAKYKVIGDNNEVVASTYIEIIARKCAIQFLEAQRI
jgi:hypothetical protein